MQFSKAYLSCYSIENLFRDYIGGPTHQLIYHHQLTLWKPLRDLLSTDPKLASRVVSISL